MDCASVWFENVTNSHSQYNFIFVVGDEEMKNKQVNIRYRDDTSSQDRGKPVDVAEAVEKIKKLREERGTYNPFPSVVKSKEDKA